MSSFCTSRRIVKSSHRHTMLRFYYLASHKKIVAIATIFLLLPTRNRVVGTFGNICFGVDVAEAVRRLDHNIGLRIF